MIKIEKKDIYNPFKIVKDYCERYNLWFIFAKKEDLIKQYIRRIFDEQGYILIAIDKNKIREELERDE